MAIVAYERFETRAKTSTSEGLKVAIIHFYTHETQEQLFDKDLIENISTDREKLLALCLELAKEAINLDFIAFALTGIRGNLLNEMNKCLINS